MTRIREAFVYPGGGATPDRPKAVRWGIKRFWWEARDPNATKTLLAEERQAGMGVGLVRDTSWPESMVGEANFAKQLSQDLTDHGFGANTGPLSCGVMIDYEGEDGHWIETVIRQFRALRPTRLMYWTMESFQGGIFTINLVQKINADPNLLIIPQLYLGDMYPASEVASIENLTGVGVSRASIHAYYGIEDEQDRPLDVPYGWDGIIYDFAKLPSIPPRAL